MSEVRTEKPRRNRDSGPADAQAAARHLYRKRQKIHPRLIDGRFQRLRILAMVVLLGLFYSVAWIRWDDQQVLLFDLPERKFHIFGLTLWPQDFFIMVLLLAAAAVTLVFFTALAGRMWCGYACPQTVWTEIFLWMERLVEGNFRHQQKLDRQPVGWRKLRIKTAKHALWIAFSLWTGFTFVGYFTPITELGGKLATFSMGPWETFWVFFYGFATYGNAGWMREQVCLYMCPYARFQGAMFDRDTLIISYDGERGEPRGGRKRGAENKPADLGDCIDCRLCVQVCPTGIDIREGLQYECISCAACIDACDGVMDAVGYPRGLIRYTSENALEGFRTRVLRPRVVVYGVLLAVLLGGIVWVLATRTPLALEVLRDRNVLYRQTDMGLVENVYTLKIANMEEQAHSFRVSASGIQGLAMDRPGMRVTVPGGEVAERPVSLRVDPVHLQRTSSSITWRIEAVDEPALAVESSSRLIGPVRR